MNAILFPSDYFHKNKIDPELQNEYNAVIESGLFSQIILFSYEDWFEKQKLIVNYTPEQEIMVVYRGWMMKPQLYSEFYQQLMEKKIHLITTPQEYEHFHCFPNIYPRIQNDTPKIMIFPKGTEIDLYAVKKEFSRFMVKDYVKSVKGSGFPAFFDRDISEEEFGRWMKIFYSYRADMFTDGICIKEYVELNKYGDCKNEYRVFYMNGKIATISRNSGQNENAPSPPLTLLEKYIHLDSKFYTIDFAELENGDFTIIEVGDGSVSGLSDQQDYREFFEKLYQSFFI